MALATRSTGAALNRLQQMIWTRLYVVFTMATISHAQTFFTNLGLYQITAQQSAVVSFYVHDYLNGNPASSMSVVQPLTSVNGAANTELFGAIAVFDDSVTVSSDPTSMEIGRARGYYVFDSMNQNNTGLEFVWTLRFNEASGFSGSTLTFKGYDQIFDYQREICITGGTGEFRMARGWADITTAAEDVAGGVAHLYVIATVFYGI